METSNVRHVRTGQFFDVPKSVLALGGAEANRWIENKLQAESLEQQIKISEAEQAARASTVQAEKSEIDQLKAIVLQQQAQIDHFQQNYVAQAPNDAIVAARDLMAASAHATALRDSARAEMEELAKFREQNSEELAGIREMLASKREINDSLRERNRMLMQRAKAGDPEAIGELNAVAIDGGDV